MPELQAFGYLVVDPGNGGGTPIPLHDRLFVGRECAGIDESRRILLADDLAVSRNHLEIRVDDEHDRAVVVDTSSNGSRINGIRIERAVPVPLRGGDRIQVGEHELEFRTDPVPVRRAQGTQPRATLALADPTEMALVAGDLINFSTISEVADHHVLARDIDRLYSELRELLAEYRGTLVDYVGDAFFASWERPADPAAPAHALGFAVAAADRVAACTAELELRYADGSPLRMGWGASMGTVIFRLMPGNVVMALGDATNVAFRISALAGREGRPTILATQALKEAAAGAVRFGDPDTIPIKGRLGTETIYGVLGF
jgi:class 3 adenylate cyclase